MTVSDNVRPTQTKVKHQILGEYLKTWTGIVFWGIKNRRTPVPSPPHFVYVDAFSFKGKYTGGDMDTSSKEPVYGSPVIGIQRLDEFAGYAAKNDMPITRNIILLEQNLDNYQMLKETLVEIGVRDRVRETTDFGSLRNGEIAIANVDATVMGSELTTYTDRPFVWSFYLLDPWGPSGIPYDFVQRIVSAPRHDVMVNFIYIAFQKNLGLAGKKDLRPADQGRLNHWEKVFGQEIWMSIVDEYQKTCLLSDGDTTEATRAGVAKYRNTLESMDSEIAAKMIALRFPDKAREMLYLFLTTHDPTGALMLNKILASAKLSEFELRHRARIAKSMRIGQLSLLSIDEMSEGIQNNNSPRLDVVEIEKSMINSFAGQHVTLKQIYKVLVETDYFPIEIQRALKNLQKAKRVEFEGKSLTNRTLIKFL